MARLRAVCQPDLVPGVQSQQVLAWDSLSALASALTSHQQRVPHTGTSALPAEPSLQPGAALSSSSMLLFLTELVVLGKVAGEEQLVPAGPKPGSPGPLCEAAHLQTLLPKDR